MHDAVNFGDPVVVAIQREFPLLWRMAVRVDHNDRAGLNSALADREADAALREVWQARTNLLAAPGSRST